MSDTCVQCPTAEGLLALKLPIATKSKFLSVLVLAGEIISADLALEGIREFLEAAKQKPWMLDQNNNWKIVDWPGRLLFLLTVAQLC